MFHIKYDDEFQYAIKYNDKICYSEWNKDIDFNFSGLNLNLVYKDIVRKINNIDELNDIDKELEKLKQINELEKQIKALGNKIRKEKQFKIKAEYNHRRNELIEEISGLREEK